MQSKPKRNIYNHLQSWWPEQNKSIWSYSHFDSWNGGIKIQIFTRDSVPLANETATTTFSSIACVFAAPIFLFVLLFTDCCGSVEYHRDRRRWWWCRCRHMTMATIELHILAITTNKSQYLMSSYAKQNRKKKHRNTEPWNSIRHEMNKTNAARVPRAKRHTVSCNCNALLYAQNQCRMPLGAWKSKESFVMSWNACQSFALNLFSFKR